MTTDEEFQAERKAALDRILQSGSPKKVIVAGPGTGKTFTFRQLLKDGDGSALLISFLGNLVRDLERDLGSVATVRTFHGYCRGLLPQMDCPGITRGVDYYPPFRLIVDEDAAILAGPLPAGAIERAYMYLDDAAGHATLGMRIGDYYDAVGHTDGVYRVCRAFGDNPGTIPQRSMLLVDEYQDFSLLEVTFISHLAERSPTLIVGDDDQALYGFKHASADYLRDLVARGEFERFDLPYCTRCTSVLVDATHRVVGQAQRLGLLAARIDKPYICFEPEKRDANARYPRIVHAACSVQHSKAPYMARFIAEQIAAVTREDIESSRSGGYPTVLIIGPSQFTGPIGNFLKAQGVANVAMPKSVQPEVHILDGYRRLVRDPASRLGWRIVLYTARPPGWEAAVERAISTGQPLGGLVDPDFCALHLGQAALVRRRQADEDLTEEEIGRLQAATGLSIESLDARLAGRVEDDSQAEVDESAPTILVTSLLGAKGLQAEHVFIVGMNNHHFPRDNHRVTDDEVCELLVALTRARQSCTVLSCRRFGADWQEQGVFISWLAPLLDEVVVDADYWRAH